MFDSCIELKYSNDDEWHKIRSNKIGGSDSSSLMGRNEYKNNVELWAEKTGRVKAKDISDKPAIIKGKQSEPLLLELFKIKHPDWKIYSPEVTYQSKEYPFMIANLDGIAETPSGIIGIEIKTTSIRRWDEWKNDIPMHYYCQVLHYMTVTGIQKFILFAMIDYINYEGENTTFLKEYNIMLDINDQAKLIKEETDFYNYILKDEKPPLKIILKA